MDNYLNLLIIDAEWTAWEGSMERNWSLENEYREIVQISAIKIYDLETLHNTKFFSIYIKPKINSTLSDYFINLTGIKQKDIETNSIDIVSGSKLLSEFIQNCHCLSWGNDIKRINDNLALISSKFRIEPSKSSDIRELFRLYGVNTSDYTSGLIDNYSNEKSIIKPGSNHNALSDCISMVSALSKFERSQGKEVLNNYLSKLKEL